SFENPINAVRVAKSLTKRLLVVETPVAAEAGGELDLGAQGARKPQRGAFALIEQIENPSPPAIGSTRISLCPGREALIFLMKRAGFSRVEVVAPPAGACEQLASGKRMMVVGYLPL